jgi:hypothetical protein
VRLLLIIDAYRGYRPTSDDFTREQGLFGTLKLATGQLVFDLKDSVAEFSCRTWIALGDVSN